jgi:hypothetical protein
METSAVERRFSSMNHPRHAFYDRWEDGSTLPDVMLGVWNASYVNYVPTNGLVIVSKFWRPGLPFEIL